MAVTLKFRVARRIEEVTFGGTEPMGHVELFPVTGGSEENKTFFKYTPTGKIEFGSINKAALDSLPLGAEVYVTIVPVGETVAPVGGEGSV